MYDVLQGMRIVEGASFIAAPSCCLHLLQLGAEVIRFDAIGGGPDFRRYPRAADGASLYWEGLNKGKKSIALDLSRPEGRELARQLVTAPGKNGGLFVTNFPAEGFLGYERLAKLRSDVIVLRVTGWGDGRSAVDYTVNSALGVPFLTGPAALGTEPVNNALPAWDLMSGAYAAVALLAAERARRETGKGEEIRLALGDVAIATMGHLGYFAEVTATGADRPRLGNSLFGAFGRDFVTADGRRLMLVAITPRQWKGLVVALKIEAAVARLESELGLSFAQDEGLRYANADRLAALVEAAVALRRYDELGQALDRNGACWGPYQTVKQAMAGDPRVSVANPILSEVRHPSGFPYLTPGSAASFGDRTRRQPTPAPRLGENTDEILANVLALSEHEIARLHDAGIVAGPGTPR